MLAFFVWFAVGKRVRATEVSSEGVYLGSFGFDEHGAMEVDANGLLSENETEWMSIQLLTSSQYNEFLEMTADGRVGCGKIHSFGGVELELDAGRQSGNITVRSGSVLYVVAFACNRSLVSRDGVMLTFRNSFGYLDTRVYNGIMVSLVLSVVAIVVAGVWFVLVSWRRRSVSKMHVMVAVMTFGPFLDYISLSTYLDEMNSRDESTILSVVWVIMRIANYTVTATVIMFASLGLSVFCEDLSRKQYARGFGASLVMVVAGVWTANWNVGDSVFPILLAFVAVAFYFREIFANVSRASVVILAALVGTEGGASESSRMYKQVRYLLLSAFILLILNILLTAMNSIIYEWRRRIVEGISQLGLIIAFCVIFRFRTPKTDPYHNPDTRKDGECLLSDLDSHSGDIDDALARPLLDDPDALPRLIPKSNV